MTHDDVDQRRRGAARVAGEVLAGHGSSSAAAVPAGGWTNTVWMTDELVVRVAPAPGPADQVREARLSALLPPQVGYPDVVDAGTLHGHEWILTRRLPAWNLEDVWPTLDGAHHAEAIEQVWEKAEHIHRVNVDDAAPHVRARSPFFPDTPAGAMAPLRRLRALDLLTERQIRVLAETMDRFWTALASPATPRVLNHGDLGMCNVLWNGGRVVSLFDVEFAVIAPVEVDLNEVLKFAFGPSSGGAATDPTDSGGLARDAATRIARSVLSTSGGIDVLLGYSTMLETWLTENELASGDSAGDLADAEPYQLLTALAEGDGGHLAPLLAAL